MYRFFSSAVAACLVLTAGAVMSPACASVDGESVRGPAIAFAQARSALLSSLADVRAAAPTPSRDDAEAALLLDLAERHLKVALLPEGAAIVAALADVPLTSVQSARRGALRAAFASLDPRAASPAVAPPLETFGNLAGAAVLRSHALARTGRAAEALALVAGSLTSVDEAPPAVRARVLPDLVEAAVTADRPALAAALHQRLIGVADLAEPGALAYLAARRDVAAGEPAAAAAGFAAAEATGTIWGHRARLAGIDLDLESGTLEPTDALGRLAGARARWRGDGEALGTLRRIARLATETGDSLAAASASGEIWSRGGRTEAAANETLAALRTFYDAGASGDLALHDLMEGHRQVAGAFRLLPGYAALSEGFADRLVSRGATEAAAVEYRLTRAHLEFGAERGLWAPSPSRLDALRLKEADAHLAGGRPDAALPLLRDPLSSSDAGPAARLAELRIRHLALIDDGPAVSAGSEVAPDLLARAARAHVLARRWAPALDAYRTLLREAGGEVAPEDAIGALLAAHHGGDAAMQARAELSLTAAGGVRAEAVEGGLAPGDDLEALSAARLRGALARADGALRVGARLAGDAPTDPAGERGGINTSLTGGP